MIKIKVVLIVCCIACSWIKAAEKSVQSLKTSLIIPCAPKHAKYLYELLKIYEQQTCPPDEAVISISEADKIEPSIIEILRKSPWLFPVKLILSEKKLFAGQNRNIACSQATGEIFICQDADDLPHPQRIEVIKYFFKKLSPDFLLHKFVYNSPDSIKQLATVKDMASLKYSYVTTYHDAWIVGYMLFGQPAIHRRVFQKVQWPDIPIDEDNVFDSNVMKNFQNCVMVYCPLYLYRSELSATPYELYRSIRLFFDLS